MISSLLVVSSISEKVLQSAAYGTGSPAFQSGYGCLTSDLRVAWTFCRALAATSGFSSSSWSSSSSTSDADSGVSSSASVFMIGAGSGSSFLGDFGFEDALAFLTSGCGASSITSSSSSSSITFLLLLGRLLAGAATSASSSTDSFLLFFAADVLAGRPRFLPVSVVLNHVSHRLVSITPVEHTIFRHNLLNLFCFYLPHLFRSNFLLIICLGLVLRGFCRETQLCLLRRSALCLCPISLGKELATDHVSPVILLYFPQEKPNNEEDEIEM